MDVGSAGNKGRGQLETELRCLWSELLGLPPRDVVPGSNFYELGGNSMLVLSMQVAITASLGLECSTAQLMEVATFADLVDCLYQAAVN